MLKLKTLLFAIVAYSFCVLTAGHLHAQNARGSLRGVVQDQRNARIASASLQFESVGSSVTRQATSNSQGEFRIDDLLPGEYHVTVTAPGFANAQANVSVAVSTVRDMTVTMRPSTVKETVNVEAQPSSVATQPIDLASAVHQTVVNEHDLQEFPLAARSFANIAYLTPGTEPVEPSDPTKARITAISTGGSSGLNNVLTVDGGDNSDDYIGGFLQNFSPDALQEFAFATSQQDADTGGATAGSVVITTRRGTNGWHGDFAIYDRQAALNARFPIENPAPNPKQPFSRQNYIGNIGGPIVKDKVWFFASLEYVHENASIAYSPASTTQFNSLAALAADGLITGIPSIAVPPNVPIPFRDHLSSVRFDWAQSAKSQWFIRASNDNYITHNALVQQATLPSTGLTTHNNYWNGVINNTYAFNSTWLGTFVFDVSTLHLTQERNSNLGFALAFPFSSTSQTISGFETYGDNQFATPITAFPQVRTQEKYQWRYDVTHSSGRHSEKFGVNFIHEPVLSGKLADTAEQLILYPNNPQYYQQNPSQFYYVPPADLCTPEPTLASGISCTNTPAGDGNFSQNVQRLALYAQDSWRATQHLTVNYGVRYQTTFGLFNANGVSQAANPSFPLLSTIGLPEEAPHDYRKQIAPRLGIAYTPGNNAKTVIRAGFGMFYNDLAQNGWVTAYTAVNGGADPAPPGIIAPGYKTPYAIHITGGVQHAFNQKWLMSADYTHETGMHGYRAYPYADFNLYKSDNRSDFNAMMLHLQGNINNRVSLIANYTLSRAKTWGCVLGELFDYVNGVCNVNQPFGPGDYGPSGEDVTSRFVLAGIYHVPGGFELSNLFQAESARPFTLTNPDTSLRININGVPETLDQFRGTPYIQFDLRVSRPIKFKERFTATPFIEFFNLFNRNNPGANYVTNIADINVPYNATTNNATVNNLNQLRVPGGALGDFFGPGTTVGIPFAAQIGGRFTF
ncbi:MAG TPA: carboxypeptidase regulatory-like domain-containing protein [Terriglobales bacterium]